MGVLTLKDFNNDRRISGLLNNFNRYIPLYLHNSIDMCKLLAKCI